MVAPMHHASGALTSFHAVASGASVFVMPQFDVTEVGRVLSEERIGFVMLVPAMIHMLLEDEEVCSRSYPHLRTIFYGGVGDLPVDAATGDRRVRLRLRPVLRHDRAAEPRVPDRRRPPTRARRSARAPAGRRTAGARIGGEDRRRGRPRGRAGHDRRDLRGGGQVMDRYWQLPEATADSAPRRLDAHRRCGLRRRRGLPLHQGPHQGHDLLGRGERLLPAKSRTCSPHIRQSPTSPSSESPTSDGVSRSTRSSCSGPVTSSTRQTSRSSAATGSPTSSVRAPWRSSRAAEERQREAAQDRAARHGTGPATGERWADGRARVRASVGQPSAGPRGSLANGVIVTEPTGDGAWETQALLCSGTVLDPGEDASSPRSSRRLASGTPRRCTACGRWHRRCCPTYPVAPRGSTRSESEVPAADRTGQCTKDTSWPSPTATGPQLHKRARRYSVAAGRAKLLRFVGGHWRRRPMESRNSCTARPGPTSRTELAALAAAVGTR